MRLVFFSLFLSALASASDVLVLQNGEQLTGTFLSADARDAQILIDDQVRTVPLAEIERMRFNADSPDAALVAPPTQDVSAPNVSVPRVPEPDASQPAPPAPVVQPTAAGSVGEREPLPAPDPAAISNCVSDEPGLRRCVLTILALLEASGLNKNESLFHDRARISGQLPDWDGIWNASLKKSGEYIRLIHLKARASSIYGHGALKVVADIEHAHGIVTFRVYFDGESRIFKIDSSYDKFGPDPGQLTAELAKTETVLNGLVNGAAVDTYSIFDNYFASGGDPMARLRGQIPPEHPQMGQIRRCGPTEVSSGSDDRVETWCIYDRHIVQIIFSFINGYVQNWDLDYGGETP